MSKEKILSRKDRKKAKREEKQAKAAAAKAKKALAAAKKEEAQDRAREKELTPRKRLPNGYPSNYFSLSKAYAKKPSVASLSSTSRFVMGDCVSCGDKNQNLQADSLQCIRCLSEEAQAVSPAVKQHSFLSDDIAEVSAAANLALMRDQERLDKQGKCCALAEAGKPCMCDEEITSETLQEFVARHDVRLKTTLKKNLPTLKSTGEYGFCAGKLCRCTANVELFATYEGLRCQLCAEALSDDAQKYNQDPEVFEKDGIYYCSTCKEDTVDCTCYDMQCDYCGSNDVSCDCCPKQIHEGGFLDDKCDCMTEDEKFDRLAEMEDKINQRNAAMFGLGGKKKEVVVEGVVNVPYNPTAALNNADDKDTAEYHWCNQHRMSHEFCKTFKHDNDGDKTWCDYHRANRSTCGSWFHPTAEHFVRDDKSSVNPNTQPQSQSSTPTGYTGDADKGKDKKPATTGFTYQACFHPPQEVIDGKTWSVWCGKGDHVETRTKGFDLIINLTGRTIRDKHTIPASMKEMQKWAGGPVQVPEMILDWPDYGIIEWPLEFWTDLMTHIDKNNLKVCVFCMGGHGRTGTAVAAMMMVSLNYTAYDAVEWLRKNYCKKVVESKSQVEYLQWLDDEIAERDKLEAEAKGETEDVTEVTEEVKPIKESKERGNCTAQPDYQNQLF